MTTTPSATKLSSCFSSVMALISSSEAPSVLGQVALLIHAYRADLSYSLNDHLLSGHVHRHEKAIVFEADHHGLSVAPSRVIQQPLFWQLATTVPVTCP